MLNFSPGSFAKTENNITSQVSRRFLHSSNTHWPWLISRSDSNDCNWTGAALSHSVLSITLDAICCLHSCVCPCARRRIPARSPLAAGRCAGNCERVRYCVCGNMKRLSACSSVWVRFAPVAWKSCGSDRAWGGHHSSPQTTLCFMWGFHPVGSSTWKGEGEEERKQIVVVCSLSNWMDVWGRGLQRRGGVWVGGETCQRNEWVCVNAYICVSIHTLCSKWWLCNENSRQASFQRPYWWLTDVSHQRDSGLPEGRSPRRGWITTVRDLFVFIYRVDPESVHLYWKASSKYISWTHWNKWNWIVCHQATPFIKVLSKQRWITRLHVLYRFILISLPKLT